MSDAAQEILQEAAAAEDVTVAAGRRGRGTRRDDARARRLGLHRARAGSAGRGVVVPGGGRGAARARRVHLARAGPGPVPGRRDHRDRGERTAARPARRRRRVRRRRWSPRSATAPGAGAPCSCSGARTTTAGVADERDALFGLGRRLGTMADQVQVRRRDQETVEELLRLDAVPPRPRRLDLPRPEDTADRDRAQHRAAGVRQTAGRGGLTSGRRDPPERRPAVQPGRRPDGDGPCGAGGRHPHGGRPGGDGARCVRSHRDGGHAPRGHLRPRRRPRSCGSWSTRTRSPGSSPTWCRTR